MRIWNSVGRFPITVLFALALTIVCIVLNHVEYRSVSEKLQFFLYFYTSTGLFLSLGLSLFRENCKSKVSGVAIVIAAHLVWLFVSIVLCQYQDVIHKLPYVLVFAALVALSVTTVIILPFLGRKDEDIPMWNFTIGIGSTAAVSLIVALVLWGGLSLLLVSFEQLFGMDVNSKLYGDMLSVSFLLVAPMLVLQGIPSAKDMHDHAPVSLPAFIRGAVLYLFVPLVSLYFITLYCYAVKIIATWELPEGWVSYLVSASMLLVVLLQLAIRPYRDKYGMFASGLVCGWMPKLMLPLLVLMSVGIGRRVSDYGMTVSRFYLIVFNLWCYVACFILWFRKNDRVMWLTYTPILIFAVLSVFPMNVSTVVRNNMVRQIRQALTDSAWNGNVMTDDDYTAWLAGLDKETAFWVDSRLDYLKDKYPHQCIEDLVAGNILTGRVAKAEKKTDGSINLYCYRMQLENTVVDIPSGMTKAIRCTWREPIDETAFEGDSLRVTFNVDEVLSFTVLFPMSDLRALADNKRSQQHAVSYDCMLTDGTLCKLYLNEFSLNYNGTTGSMHIDALLFY